MLVALSVLTVESVAYSRDAHVLKQVIVVRHRLRRRQRRAVAQNAHAATLFMLECLKRAPGT
jgi:hypothetical protein